MPISRLPAYRDYPPTFNGGGGSAYRSGDTVADLIMRSGQAQAQAEYQGADAWNGAIHGITDQLNGYLQHYGKSAQEKADSKEVQSAIAKATGPGTTRATPGFDVNGNPVAEGKTTPPDLNAIMGGLSPDLRKQAMSSLAEIQSYGAKVQEHNFQVQKLQGELADAETKRKAAALDYGAGLGKQINQWSKGPDGGLSAAIVGFGHAKEMGTQGLEEYAPMLKGLSDEWNAALQSGDPLAIQAAGEKNRQTIGPFAQKLQMGGTPDWQQKNKAKVTSIGEGGRLVNEETGAVVAEGAPKETNLQHVETAAGIQTFDPKKGTLGPVIAKGKPTAMGGMNGLYADVDPKAIAEAIKRGEQPPQITDLGRPVGAAVSSELAKSGYNLAKAQTDWKATQKHIATLNGAQQLRLNQAVNSLPDLLDSVDSLASQWKGGRFPVLNKANLALAKGGAYGTEVASVANKLDAQIADVTADLAVVYMGGNSPTDHGLSLASKSLSGDWDEKVLHDMVKMAKGNVTIRRNSIMNTGVAGASAGNPYAPPPPTGAAPAGGTPEPTATGPNGQKLALRNGQWVQVQ